MARWMIAAKKADFRGIAERFGVDQVTARLLRNRDVISDEAIEKWLHGDISMLNDPHLLADIEKAAALLKEAIEGSKKIRIIGDYDVDGICSTYILYRGLTALGAAQTDFCLPDRVRDGYGLNASLIRQAGEDGVDFILTCDNGIRAIDEIKLAGSLGIKVVVTDHHETKKDDAGGDILPEALAVVDPWREDDEYPFKKICGAVVAMKLMQVLFEMKEPPELQSVLDEFTVFAAFATICDVMPLVDENRIIVREGISHIPDRLNVGLDSLVSACGLDRDRMKTTDFEFKLGPCMNATGRLDTATRAMELLTAADEAQASVMAGDMLAINEERKTVTADGVKKAAEIYEAEGLENDSILVIYLPECHESVAGIIAGRLRERYSRPAIVFTDCADPDCMKGSGRSVPAYDMYGGLSEFEELYVKFGGHEQAAGLTIRRENLDALRRGLNDRCSLGSDELEGVLHIDMLMPMSYASLDLVRQFSLLEPFGSGNRAPLFADRDVQIVSGKMVGKHKNFGKYVIADNSGRKYDMICFEGIERFNEFLKGKFGADGVRDIYESYRVREEYRFNMAYHVEINSYMGRESLQFRLKDFC